MAGALGRVDGAAARRARARIPSLDLVPEEILTPPMRGGSGGLDRPAAALVLDGWLRRLGRQEALCRRVLGALAGRFLAMRACHSLGFARLSDWSRERLGMGAREVQELARTAARLRSLPAIGEAFDRGELSWAKVRLLTRVAGADDERAWVALARERPVRALERLIREARSGAGKSESNESSTAHGQADAADDDDDDDTCDGEPIARFAVPCPRWVLTSWNRAVELARRIAGEQLPPWQAAEAIAAEALSASDLDRRALGGPWVSPDELWREHDRRDAATKAARERAHALEREAEGAAERKGECDDTRVGHECLDWTALGEALPLEVERLAEGCETLDPWELDARLREVVRALQRIDWQTGRLLRIFHDIRGPELAGFRSLSTYVRERLGCSSRRARGLIAIERRSWQAPALGDAYREGRLSWVRALAILPAVRTSTPDAGAAWVERAGEVTVRRLMDEVDHALEHQERPGEIWPPAPDADVRLVGDVSTTDERPTADEDARERQMCSHRRLHRWGVQDSVIAFTGPESVVVLLETAMRSFGLPHEPAWSRLERVLSHVRIEWQSRPRHRDPIFDRDGWRCAVPACSSRKNLHDHHVLFRSRGGSDDLENRTTVCAWHHLRGIHEGRIRAFGRAPNEIVWEIGRQASGAPLFRARGDRYVAATG